jgi:transposase-like protein
MSSVAGGGRRGKKRRVLGEPTVVSAEEFAGMELDAKVEFIRALIPLGLRAVEEMLDAEVTQLAGPRYSREGGQPGLARHGSNRSSVRLAGQRVPLPVPRVRNVVEGKEVPLASLQALRAEPGAVDETLLRRVLYGLSCHNYEATAAAIPGAIGLSASAVSRQFIEASAAKLRELSERDLSGFDVVALVLDGKTFAQDTMVTALGVTLDGHKVILGVVQASTENAEVLARFLHGLLDRGLKIDQGILVVLDGGKGLRAAVRRALGNKALVHRCQWHKRENVVEHLSKKEQAWWRKRLQRAYERPTYEEAKTALKEIRRDLSERNLSAVGSLDEGLEETLTLHRLGVFPLVGISLKTTNCLESIFSQVETRTGRVCHWKNSSQKHRWLAAALLDLEPRLRRVRGYQHLPRLREAIQRELNKPGEGVHEAEELAGKEVA